MRIACECEWASWFKGGPAPDEILKLEATHGWPARLERWGYISERTLTDMESGRRDTARQSLRKVRAET